MVLHRDSPLLGAVTKGKQGRGEREGSEAQSPQCRLSAMEKIEVGRGSWIASRFRLPFLIRSQLGERARMLFDYVFPLREPLSRRGEGELVRVHSFSFPLRKAMRKSRRGRRMTVH